MPFWVVPRGAVPPVPHHSLNGHSQRKQLRRSHRRTEVVVGPRSHPSTIVCFRLVAHCCDRRPFPKADSFAMPYFLHMNSYSFFSRTQFLRPFYLFFVVCRFAGGIVIFPICGFLNQNDSKHFLYFPNFGICIWCH